MNVERLAHTYLLSVDDHVCILSVEAEVLNLSGARPFIPSNPSSTQLPNWMSYEGPFPPISMRLTHSVINEFGAL